jgi:hypothetical protein
LIWKNKNKILEGILNYLFRKPYIERIAVRRRKICESNICSFYKPLGDAHNCYVKGEPCCSGCGCKLAWKQRSLSSYCHLRDIGERPLWDSEMTEQDEKIYREKTGLKND